MNRIRTVAALVAAIAVAACADAPTAPEASAVALASGSSTCSPTLSGPTAVVADGQTTYTYKAIYNSNDCPDVASVTWTVTGGSVYIHAGIKAYILPTQGAKCMHVQENIAWVGGTNSYLYKLARVDGYTGVCTSVSVE
jgi:hypothetical protein